MTEELDCFPTLEKAEEYCALKKRNAEMIRRLLCWLGCHVSVIALNCILRIKTALRY